MRTRLFLITVVLLAVQLYPYGHSTPGIPESHRDEPRYVEVPYTADPPVLDGSIGALEWQTQFTSWYFDPFDGESLGELHPEAGSDEEFTNQSDLSVTFYLLYDDEYLYFAANVTDDTIVVDSGSACENDDGVELRIDGAHDRDEDQYAGDPWPGFEDGTTFLALADGSCFRDMSNSTPYERDFGPSDDWFARSRSVPSAHYYIMEMRVRLDAIYSPLPNGTIGLDVGVNDDDNGGDSRTSLEWSGRETGPGEVPAYRNETMWGSAHLRSYVMAVLPERIYVDEDKNVMITTNLSRGNHPGFETGANFTWKLPLFEEDHWNNFTTSGPVFIHTFYQPRSYYVLILTVRDPSGVSDTTSTHIHVRDVTPPEINAVNGSALEEIPYTYVLNATDNVGISFVNWSLLDGEWVNKTTSSVSFSHTFEHPGNFTLFFTVNDAANNSDGGSAVIMVLDNAPPVINGFISDMIINTTAFTKLLSPDAYDDTPEGPSRNLSFEWGFTGLYAVYTFTGSDPTVNIPVPGYYTVTLTVTDAIGLSSHILFNVTVDDTTPPHPDFFLPSELDEGMSVELNASRSFDNDPLYREGVLFEWTVEMEDGSWSTEGSGPILDVVFSHPGPIRITLVMVDPSGNRASRVREVDILDSVPPTIVLSIPEMVDQGESFLLDLSGSRDNMGIVSVHYSIYRNISGKLSEVFSTPYFGVRVWNLTPVEYYRLDDLWLVLQIPGEYHVYVTLEDRRGLEGKASAVVNVRDSVPPTARTNRSLIVIYPGEAVYLSGSDSVDENGPVNFQWSLENGDIIGTGEELSWTPPGIGQYNITLRVIDGGGNSDETICRVQVIETVGSVGGADWTPVRILWVVTAAAMIFIGILVLMRIGKKRPPAVVSPEE